MAVIFCSAVVSISQNDQNVQSRCALRTLAVLYRLDLLGHSSRQLCHLK